MQFSIGAQIEEVEREIALRDKVYPKWVARGSMSPEKAAFHMARLRAVRASLQWLRDNEQRIKQGLAHDPGRTGTAG